MPENLTEKVLHLFDLNAEQRVAAKERGRDVVVTAGAGSGKTSTLVARYTCLLAEGTEPRRIAAVTFSIKAAQEMRSRVRSTLMKLQEQALEDAERLVWSRLSAQIDSARIGTIHSLCAEIIRSHPAEAGVDPRFDVLEEGLSEAIKAQVVEDTMAGLVEEERFLPLLFNLPVRDLSSLLTEMIHRRLETQESFEHAVDPKTRLTAELKQRLSSPAILECINALRGMSPKELLQEAGPPLAEMAQNLLACWSLAEKALERKDPTNCAIHLFEARRKYLKGNLGKKDGAVKPIIAQLQESFDSLINPLTGGKDSKAVPPSPEAEALFEQLLPLLREAFTRAHQAYQQHLDRRQALDFDDLEYRAQQLLTIPELRSRWRQELDAIMVDEYQDTNPRQRDIVNALAGERGCLFLVGDMRQSIYRFRRADVTVFKQEQERIDKAGGLPVELNLTYRAHAALLDATGDLLSEVIGTAQDPTKDYYVPYTPLVAFKKLPEHPVQPPHIEFVLGVGEDTELGRQHMAQALASRLNELKKEGQITKWDQVALLFRASTGFPYYEEALEAASIPFVTVAGKGFYDRPEIRDLLNILRALADPLDDLAFAGVLRSPAFRLSDAALYQLRQSRLPYWETLRGDLSQLSEQDQAAARRAFSVLNTVLPLVDRVPVAELLKRVIDELDYRSILATADIAFEHGQAIKAAGRLWRNLDKLVSDTQLSQAANVREFLDMLATMNDAGAREGEASAEADGSVRLMTIHKAKGLQYPIVVLADAARGRRTDQSKSYLSDELGVTFKLDPAPMLFKLAKMLDKDKDDCEDLRLLYVALTRAQAKLIISSHATTVEDKPLQLKEWAKSLDEAAGAASCNPSARGGQAFTAQTSHNHPIRAFCQAEALPVRTYQPEQAISKMVFEPNLLPLYQPVEGFGQVESLDEEQLVWQKQSWRATGTEDRVPGSVLGSIVHKALQRWLFPGDPALEKLLENEAWQVGLAAQTARESVVSKAAMLLARLRAHPLWEEINRAPERHAELTYTNAVDGQVEYRVIDLLYRDANGWHVIDFKTDRISSQAQKANLVERYSQQLRCYTDFVSSQLKQPVDGKLCFLDDMGKMDLVKV